MATGAEAANKNAMTALLKWTNEISDIIFLNVGKGLDNGSSCKSGFQGISVLRN
jgi:hypothetical protein